MIYYRQLAWPGYQAIETEALAFAHLEGWATNPRVPAWVDLDLDKVKQSIPSLVKFAEDWSFTLLKASFFISDQHNISSIHRDSNDRDARINFPVMNCANSLTMFYQVDPASYIEDTTPEGVKYMRSKDQNAILVDQVSLTAPTVINIKAAHRVRNDQQRRISLTVEVSPDPTYLLVMQ